MKRSGLCSGCAQSRACIFEKEPAVWLCEEFSYASHTAHLAAQPRTKRAVLREEITEEE